MKYRVGFGHPSTLPPPATGWPCRDWFICLSSRSPFDTDDRDAADDAYEAAAEWVRTADEEAAYDAGAEWVRTGS